MGYFETPTVNWISFERLQQLRLFSILALIPMMVVPIILNDLTYKCNTILNDLKFSKTIILYYFENLHFQLIGYFNGVIFQTVFDTNKLPLGLSNYLNLCTKKFNI